MRISDWSSDVCSSDLWEQRFQANRAKIAELYDERFCRMWEAYLIGCEMGFRYQGDRKSVVLGKSVSVRVDLGGRRIIKKKNNITDDTMKSLIKEYNEIYQKYMNYECKNRHKKK